MKHERLENTAAVVFDFDGTLAELNIDFPALYVRLFELTEHYGVDRAALKEVYLIELIDEITAALGDGAGKQFLAEANRLGMILDASHASDDVFDQMLALSSTPIILSHSGAKAVFNHPRNIDDTRIMKLAAAGGVIQINAYTDYLVATPAIPARNTAMRALGSKYGPFRTLSGNTLKAYMAERHGIEAQYPLPKASIDNVMDHLLHVLKLVGPDHVGIGLDMDGGGGVTGVEDVAGIPEITSRLLAAGYSEADLAKIWGANALRLLRQAEAEAAR